MDKPKVLVYVDQEFEEKYKSLTEDAQRKAFKDYMQKVSEQVKIDYQITLEGMKEDAAMFRGLMIEVRKEFEKFMDEHLQANYKLWERYHADLPSLNQKVQAFQTGLKPFNQEGKCLICNTNEDKECFLMPIDGTRDEDGKIEEAKQVHVDCFMNKINQFRFNQEIRGIYLKL